MKKRLKKKYYRLNFNIKVPEVRLIDARGKQIGIVSIQEALNQAQSTGLDLIEVVPDARPPVCKIVDFKKFLFEQKKKRKISVGKKQEVKEIRFKQPFIAENDLKIKIERAQEFLRESNKVKFVVRLFGRMITRKQYAYDLFEKIHQQLKEDGETETAPKFIGRQLMMTLKPKKIKK